jgi:hypothetical protein
MQYAIVQMVEMLHYNLEGRGFESWWRHWILFNLPNPYEYQKIFLGESVAGV